MQFLPRSIVRRVATLSLLALATTIFSGSATPLPAQRAESHNVAGANGAVAAERVLFPEVRLRKLHLVRPDLVPYPLFYEVYC